eukprot:m.110098 g.110098  ORF g.110098 m.110098 type:complete len:56 (-) comp16970_c0_seq3:666-833(-)
MMRSRQESCFRLLGHDESTGSVNCIKLSCCAISKEDGTFVITTTLEMTGLLILGA